MKKFKDHVDDEDLNQFEEDTMGNLKEQILKKKRIIKILLKTTP